MIQLREFDMDKVLDQMEEARELDELYDTKKNTLEAEEVLLALSCLGLQSHMMHIIEIEPE